MRLLSRSQLRRRLALLGATALVFTIGLWITEITISSFDGVTPWLVFAVLLGALSLMSLTRWRAGAVDEDQTEWQPALMMRVLAGGLAFQAGVLGYFVSNDVVAASVGCGGFLFSLAYAINAVGSLGFAPSR